MLYTRAITHTKWIPIEFNKFQQVLPETFSRSMSKLQVKFDVWKITKIHCTYNAYSFFFHWVPPDDRNVFRSWAPIAVHKSNIQVYVVTTNQRSRAYYKRNNKSHIFCTFCKLNIEALFGRNKENRYVQSSLSTWIYICNTHTCM